MLQYAVRVVRPSVHDVQVCFSHRLEYVENNFTADYLRVSAWADPNMGDLIQQEHLNIRVE